MASPGLRLSLYLSESCNERSPGKRIGESEKVSGTGQLPPRGGGWHSPPAQRGRTRKVAAHMGAGAGTGSGTGIGIGNGAGGAAGALGAAVAALYTATLPPALPGGDAGNVPAHRTSARGGWCIAGSLRRGAWGDEPLGPGASLSPRGVAVTP